MAIYDKPVRLLMHDLVKDLRLAKGQVLTREQAVDWFRRRYPKIKESTIGAHLIRMSTNAPSRVHYSARPGDDDLFYQVDGSRFRLYDASVDPPPIRERATAGEPTSEPETPTVAPPEEFAYEADLRNFLAKNLSILEPGLRLFEDEGITGIEFPVGGRFIDILAVDSAQNYVVIELKVSRGYDRVVGQLLRYMAWVREHHAEGAQRVRGVIVAREISDDLRLACSALSDVALYEYQLAVTLKRVQQTGPPAG
jgi:hypothetical protein